MTDEEPPDRDVPSDARATLRGTLEADPTPAAPAPEAEHRDPQPRSVPGYAILEELGHGTTGFVFRARQANLERDVAVKTMRSSGFTDEGRRVRFLSEALVTGSLDHPNVVPTHDLVFDEQGHPSIAMKLIGGVTWDDLLHPRPDRARERAREFGFDRHLEILQSVCNAVAFAHSRGIIHRDLKPSNVMVGEFGEVLVMDWGLAVSVDDRDERADGWRAPDRSSVSEPEGSPAYMAPEMAAGRGDALSRASDVYLLGAILFEIVTGSPPHIASSVAAALTSAARGERPPYPANVPQELRALCDRALAVDPEDRHADAAEFQRALREFASHRQSLAVADAAGARLAGARARLASAAGTADPSVSYGDLAEAASGFRQAQLLWPENARAIAGERDARIAHARAALASGDLTLARILVEDLGGPEVDGLRADLETATVARERATRRAATRRRSLLAVGIVILALLFSAGFFLFSMQQVGDEIADEMRSVLIVEARASLQRSVEEGARDLELVRSKAEFALYIYGRSVEGAFAAASAPAQSREPLWSRDIDAGRASAGLVALPRYGRIENGARVASPVSLEQPSFFAPQDVDASRLREEVARLELITPTVRWLYGRSPAIARFFAGIADTRLYVQYPGSGNLPPDYDPTRRDWYQLGLPAHGVATTQPYRDQTTQQLVISAVTPLLVGPDRIGVAGVDFDVESLLKSRRPEEDWAKDMRVSIARLEDESGPQIFALAGEVPGEDGEVGHDPTARIDLTPDPDLRTAFLRVHRTGRSEVVHTDDERGDWFWAIAPIPQTKVFLVMAARSADVTEEADAIESQIRGQTTEQIVRALVHAGAFLMLVLAVISVVTLGGPRAPKRS